MQNKEDEAMKRLQPKAYSNIEHMAKELETRVTFVSELVNDTGQQLDGKIDDAGITLNINADDPMRYIATHEFGHRMKQLSKESWGKYQNYVVKYWQKKGKYDIKMQALREVYGESMSADELHEELACDFGEEMFGSDA